MTTRRPLPRVRHARGLDAEAVAEVHVAAWKVAYPGLVDQGYLDGLRAADHVQGWRRRIYSRALGTTQVALDPRGFVIGFVSYGPSRDPDTDGAGELYSLHVHPDHWGRGVAKALFDACVRALRRAGFRELHLWVMENDPRATGFYRGRGLSPDGSYKRDEPDDGVRLDLVRYTGWIDQRLPPVTPRALRCACARALSVGLALAAIPTLALAAKGNPYGALAALVGVTVIPASLIEGWERDSLGRHDLRVCSASILASLLGCALLIGSAVYVSEAVGQGKGLVGGIQAVLSFFTSSFSLFVFAVLCGTWSLLLGIGALGDFYDYTRATLRVVLGYAAGLPALIGMTLGVSGGDASGGLLVGLGLGAWGLMAGTGGVLVLRACYELGERFEAWLYPIEPRDLLSAAGTPASRS
ncbi:MAG TPA: hypothetical protein DEA08_12805 [Planctomycetes bacterium]|nr:hypothetical protein [Planctomycetota bacterium]